ncbi:unnamed protein product [Miscanthus lutarioriparius]|uniref:Uncharacterized protein n=1 Tax=Miscanthus lutarioriparius TaxID=422564 RepID=A0A811MXB8_9POAL|nr:unnamed protein product [Miscanthus lutarioriparius]
MDYTLAALKIFGSQLADCTEAPSSEGSSAAQMLNGIRFQRAWIQGVILSADYNEAGDGRLLLDDGSCIADLFVLPKEAEGRYWRPGMYVMVIGAYIAAESKDNYPAIKVPYSSLVTPQVCPCLLVFLFPTIYRVLEVLSTKNWRFSLCDLCSLILLQTSF